MTGLKVDASDYKQFADAVHHADKELSKSIRKALRDSARPLGMAIIRAGSEQMPRRGGLRGRIQSAKVGVLASFGSNPKVVLKLTDAKGDSLKALDEGTLRHPVYKQQGRKTAWVSQRVPSGTFTRAFAEGAPLVRRKVNDAVQGVLDEVGRKV